MYSFLSFFIPYYDAIFSPKKKVPISLDTARVDECGGKKVGFHIITGSIFTSREAELCIKIAKDLTDYIEKVL